MQQHIELTDCDGDSLELFDFVEESPGGIDPGEEALLRLPIPDEGENLGGATHAAVLLSRDNARHVYDWLADFFSFPR